MSIIRTGFIRSVLGLGIVLGGVAAGEAGLPAISVRLPQSAYTLQLSGDAVTAPNIQLHRSEKELRGRALGKVANLSLKKDGVFGVLGDDPVNLKVRKEGDTLSAEGGFMGRPARLRFNPKVLELSLNGCRYDLTYTEGHYEGPRSCDSRLLPPVQLTLPAVLLERAPAEQAALLLFAFTEADGQ